MTTYLKKAAWLLIYMLAGAAIGALGGSLVGVAGGLLLTFYNNNFLQETAPMGSYIFWAKFGAYLGAVFITLPGALGGFVCGIIRISTHEHIGPDVHTTSQEDLAGKR